MLHNSRFGKSLVSDEFHQMCIDFHVEATVQPFPSPGDMSMLRMITFRNFNMETIKVIQSNGKISHIPGKGTVQVMLTPNESLPLFEKVA